MLFLKYLWNPSKHDMNYQSSLEHYKWDLVGQLGIPGLDMSLSYACYVFAWLGRVLVW